MTELVQPLFRCYFLTHVQCTVHIVTLMFSIISDMFNVTSLIIVCYFDKSWTLSFRHSGFEVTVCQYTCKSACMSVYMCTYRWPSVKLDTSVCNFRPAWIKVCLLKCGVFVIFQLTLQRRNFKTTEYQEKIGLVAVHVCKMVKFEVSWIYSLNPPVLDMNIQIHPTMTIFELHCPDNKGAFKQNQDVEKFSRLPQNCLTLIRS